MFDDSFLKCKNWTISKTATIQACLEKMVLRKADFLCVVDENNKLEGRITLYRVAVLEKRNNRIIDDPNLIEIVDAVVLAEKEVFKWPKQTKENYQIVVSEKGIYQGIIYEVDVLRWDMSHFSTLLNQLDTIMNVLGWGYMVATETKIMSYSQSVLQLLGQRTGTLNEIKDIPGATYILKALQGGVSFTDIAITCNNINLLFTIQPIVFETSVESVLIIVRDASKLQHLIVPETLFASMNEAVNVIDEHGIVQYANPASEHYIGLPREKMIGRPLSDFATNSLLITKVIKTKQACFDERLIVGDDIFIVNAIPLFINGVFKGGVAFFRDLSEINNLTWHINIEESAQRRQALSNTSGDFEGGFSELVGKKGEIRPVIEKAQRCIAALGGPRHCVITGETGTGKSTMARAMYLFAKKVSVIGPDAPFVEVNCAQFTNADIAAAEIFGTEKGAFTGALDKKGLVEIANQGILFLDEAHALGPYQTMLCTLIENGVLRRLGSRSEKKVNVIIIAASTKNLRDFFLPELYQRLAQYEMYMEPLRKWSNKDKLELLESFVQRYEESVKHKYGIDLNITISPEAQNRLILASYPRNVRQFLDVVNLTIDTAVPLVYEVRSRLKKINGLILEKHLPKELFADSDKPQISNFQLNNHEKIMARINTLHQQEWGPRKIASQLKKEGLSIEYYQVAYILKKRKDNY